MHHPRIGVKGPFEFDTENMAMHTCIMFTTTTAPRNRTARLRGYQLNQTGTAVINLLHFGWARVEALSPSIMALIPEHNRQVISRHMGGAG